MAGKERIAVVTGGAGFIGSHIAEALIARHFRVRIIDNLVTGFESNLPRDTARFEFHRADVCDAARMRELVSGAECVFHQAALASVPMSLERPLEVNRVCVEGTLSMLEAARANGVKRFVYAASSSCYGDSAYSAKRESDVLQPLSPYAAAKLGGEHYCKAYFHSFGLETVCLRSYNVFGPRQDPNRPYAAVIPLIITAILGEQRPN
ncbi:MAG: NAD-dependent epimerase/dehydratase family protein, partial [Planctomycetota bacterium]